MKCHNDTGTCMQRPKCEHACNARGSWQLPTVTAAQADEFQAIARDAARYRWLRNYRVDSYLAGGSHEQLDAEVDAGMKAEPAKTRGCENGCNGCDECTDY